MLPESVLDEPVRSDNHSTAQDAGAQMLAALERIPTHYSVESMSVWQFDEQAVRSPGKWCWSFRIATTIGGYGREFRTPEGIRHTRYLQAIEAIKAAGETR